MEQLTTRYSIDESNLVARRAYIKLTDDDVRILARLKPWAHNAAPKIVRELYDHQFAFPATREYFAKQAHKHNQDLDALRVHLEKAQAGYFTSIFDAAAGDGFGLSYFESRLKVGRVHNVIDLPLKWYVGTYVDYLDIVRKHLRRSFALQPRLRARAERSIAAVFNYDMQAVVEAFMLDMMESAGMDLDSAKVAAGHDVTDYVGDIKRAFAEGIEKFAEETDAFSSALARGDLSMTIEVRSEKDVVRRSIRDCVAQLREIIVQLQRSVRVVVTSTAAITEAVNSAEESVSAVKQESAFQQESAVCAAEAMRQAAEAVEIVAQSAEHMAGEADKSLEVANAAGLAVQETAASMNSIRGRMVSSVAAIRDLGAKGSEVGVIVNTISEIADQTNLLALNAAIEAARAGEQGAGFAVVADEVRKLAERSASATKDISSLISSMQNQVTLAVSSIEGTQADVEEGVVRSKDAGAALSASVESAQVMATETSTLTAVATEMAAQVEELLATIECVAEGARNNDRRVTETAAATARVKDAGEQLRQTSATLQTLADRFHVESHAGGQRFDQSKAA